MINARNLGIKVIEDVRRNWFFAGSARASKPTSSNWTPSWCKRHFI